MRGMAAPSSSLSSCISSSHSSSPFPTYRAFQFKNQNHSLLTKKPWRLLKTMPLFLRSAHIPISQCYSPVSEPGETQTHRRDLLVFGFSGSAYLLFPPASFADSAAITQNEAISMALVVDEINAYSFSYPVALPSKKFVFKWVESRKPERYSSAAPLSPDARQRIVSERVDMIDNVVISVSIGPPNSRFLPSKDTNTWNAKDVADSVLSDKSALRVTTGQRMAESSVLDAHSSEVDGQPYWYYEYLVRKSPTKSVQEGNIFRHYLSSTAERDGYLYSVNASTLGKQWKVMGPCLKKTVDSFRLLPPTENYVPPYKDPWRFW